MTRNLSWNDMQLLRGKTQQNKLWARKYTNIFYDSIGSYHSLSNQPVPVQTLS